MTTEEEREKSSKISSMVIPAISRFFFFFFLFSEVNTNNFSLSFSLLISFVYFKPLSTIKVYYYFLVSIKKKTIFTNILLILYVLGLGFVMSWRTRSFKITASLSPSKNLTYISVVFISVFNPNSTFLGFVFHFRKFSPFLCFS